MIRTNVNNKSRFFNFQKYKVASEALLNVLSPKAQVTLINSQMYPTYVDVYYLKGIEQNRSKISIQSLETFIQECYSILPKNDGIDMNISIYLEENLKLICEAYLASGKETISL